jgi:histidine triad (HIT) family protein
VTEPQSSCLFCKIVSGDVPATNVLETERVIAFRDINPQAPTHVLLVPKAHHPDVRALAAADPDVLAELVLQAAEIAKQEGIDDRGYRIVVNTGPEAGQTVAHVHFHLLGGRGLGWPPG